VTIRCRPVSLLLVGLFLWSSACTKWVPLEPPYTPSQTEYGKLRITNERGVPVELKEPRLESDSVWGTMVESYWERGDLKHRSSRVAIPMESVQKIEKRGGDGVATIGLVVGIVGGLGLISAAVGGDMFEDYCAFGELPSGRCRPLWDDDPSN